MIKTRMSGSNIDLIVVGVRSYSFNCPSLSLSQLHAVDKLVEAAYIEGGKEVANRFAKISDSKVIAPDPICLKGMIIPSDATHYFKEKDGGVILIKSYVDGAKIIDGLHSGEWSEMELVDSFWGGDDGVEPIPVHLIGRSSPVGVGSKEFK